MQNIGIRMTTAFVTICLLAVGYGNLPAEAGNDNGIRTNYTLDAMASPHLPIKIDDNGGFVVGVNGVVSGKGTESSPYIIENWQINASSTGYGVYIGNSTVYYIVRNCEIISSDYKSWEPHLKGCGIAIFNSSNGIVENNLIRICSIGISVEGIFGQPAIQNNHVRENTVTFAGSHANSSFITMISSNSSSITGNTLRSSGKWGIQTSGCGGIRVIGNMITGVKENAFVGYMDDFCEISANQVCDSRMGIYLDSCHWAIVRHNNITNLTSSGMPLWWDENTFVMWNRINGTYMGIDFVGYDCVFQGNIINKSSTKGIEFGGAGNYITGNVVTNSSQYGFYSESGNNNTILWNKIIDTGSDGIYMRWQDDNSFKYNHINNVYEKNPIYGAYLEDCSRNTILYNNFSNTDNYGILFYKSDKNKVVKNSFVNNSGAGAQASTGQYPYDNIWDDGIWGNYWSSYVSKYPNATNNGTVWSTPYKIRDTSYGPVLDSFPLVFTPALPTQNQYPVASIDSVIPNPALPGEKIEFTGHGNDSDSDTIVKHLWWSSINGYLSNESSFNTTTLSIGTHTIYFVVLDSAGLWSDVVSLVVVVGMPSITEFMVIPTVLLATSLIAIFIIVVVRELYNVNNQRKNKR